VCARVCVAAPISDFIPEQMPRVLLIPPNRALSPLFTHPPNFTKHSPEAAIGKMTRCEPRRELRNLRVDSGKPAFNDPTVFAHPRK
jgi:hypothetical protein